MDYTNSEIAVELAASSLSLNRRLLGRVLIGAEAQESGDVSGLFQIRIIFDELDLRPVAQGQIDESVGHVGEFAGRVAANGTLADQPRIQMAAGGALSRLTPQTSPNAHTRHSLASQPA